MAEASAADGKMKDLKISETKKSKKDGNPKKAAKPQQQQKKKVSYGQRRAEAAGQIID
jgi:prolyl-tRNA synthetase